MKTLRRSEPKRKSSENRGVDRINRNWEFLAILSFLLYRNKRLKQRFLQWLTMNINVLSLMPEPSSSLKWPFGGEVLACRTWGWCEVLQRTCFAFETGRKVGKLGWELVRCLLYCCVRPIQKGVLKRKQGNHVFWRRESWTVTEGQLVHKMLPCIPGSSCWMLLVCLSVCPSHIESFQEAEPVST